MCETKKKRRREKSTGEGGSKGKKGRRKSQERGKIHSQKPLSVFRRYVGGVLLFDARIKKREACKTKGKDGFLFREEKPRPLLTSREKHEEGAPVRLDPTAMIFKREKKKKKTGLR